MLKDKLLRKGIIIFTTAIVVMFVTIGVGLKIFTKTNYDIKVITDNGHSFFIFDTSFKEYYLMNSSIRTKVKTDAFEVLPKLLSEDQIQQLNELEKEDAIFSASQYEDTQDCVFFFEDFIYYSRYYDVIEKQSTQQEQQEAKKNIYKYNIQTKEITAIPRQENVLSSVHLQSEALQYIFPDLKSAISKKCSNGYDCDDIYYDNGRVFFETYYSSSSKGTISYLYEYIPNSNQTRKIAKFHSDIVDIDFVG